LKILGYIVPEFWRSLTNSPIRVTDFTESIALELLNVQVSCQSEALDLSVGRLDRSIKMG